MAEDLPSVSSPLNQKQTENNLDQAIWLADT